MNKNQLPTGHVNDTKKDVTIMEKPYGHITKTVEGTTHTLTVSVNDKGKEQLSKKENP